MKSFLVLVALSATPVFLMAQQPRVKPPVDSDVDCSQNPFRELCEEAQKQARDAERKIEKANSIKPEQNLPIPQQRLDQKLENGEWTRKDAKGKSDEQIMKEEAKEIAKGFLEKVAKREPITLVDSAKAAARASKPSYAQAPTVESQHLTLAQKQQVQIQMEKMYAPYMKAKAEADRAALASAKATAQALAIREAQDRADAAALVARNALTFSYRPSYEPSSTYEDPCHGRSRCVVH